MFKVDESYDWKEDLKVTTIKMIKYIIMSIIFAVIINQFIGFITISGHSMDPTLYDSEKGILDKFTYNTREPERNEIVLFYPPVVSYSVFVKRVVGVPGDTIEIKDHQVYLNGEMLQEPYLNEQMNYSAMNKITLGKGEFFLMGDNRNNSTDSRHFGPVRKENILGKMMFH